MKCTPISPSFRLIAFTSEVCRRFGRSCHRVRRAVTARGYTSRHSVFAQTYDDFSTVELYARRTWGSRPPMDPTDVRLVLEMRRIPDDGQQHREVQLLSTRSSLLACSTYLSAAGPN